MSHEPIQIELEAVEEPDRPLGEPPRFSVQITNTSDQPVWMVGVLPGSEGSRYPQYTVDIEGPSGPVETRLPEGLDMVRGLQVEDFVELGPGESFDPQAGERFVPVQSLAWFRPTQPGRYRVKLRFDATAPDPRQWLGDTPVRNRSQVESLIQQVPAIEVWSNAVEIEWPGEREPAPSQ